MPLFRCSKCGCVENTALSNFWTRNLPTRAEVLLGGGAGGGMQLRDERRRCDHKFVDSTHCLKCGWKPPLCSECDPAIGVWHGEFPKRPWDAAAQKNSGMPPGLE